MSRFEVFEHTADVGMRVEAETIDALFVESARGVLSLIVENPEAVRPTRTVEIDLEAEDVEGLFVDWLRELIYRFETDHLLFADFTLHITTDHHRLHADCRGELADWSRHLPDNELKAVTYHQLRVERTDRGWEAEVIFDI